METTTDAKVTAKTLQLWSLYYLEEEPPPPKSTIRLKVGENTVGRDADSDVVVKNVICSRQHAELLVWETDGNGVSRVDISDKSVS